MNSSTQRIRVCAAYAGEVREASVEWSPGLTVGAAAQQADLLPAEEIAGLGIFGLRVDAQTPLSAGDRVEIYRRLAQEPREHRRARAARRGRAVPDGRGET